jgi:lysozyme
MKGMAYIPVAERSQTTSNRSGYVPVARRKGLSAVGQYGSDALTAALNLIKKEEGLRTEAYQDQTGKWTIGFGNTVLNGRPVRKGDRITVSQAAQMMRDSVVNEYTTFAKRIKSKLSPEQFAALTSFEYNLGPGVWQDATGSKILSLVDSGRAREAGQLMTQYSKSRNPTTQALEVNPVLEKRRKREAQMLASSTRPTDSGVEDWTPSSGYIPVAQRGVVATGLASSQPSQERGYVPVAERMT